jgi:pimeloyl-ACP methyl ester carboxylesterase
MTPASWSSVRGLILSNGRLYFAGGESHTGDKIEMGIASATVYVKLRAVAINGLYVDDRAGSAAVPVVLVHGAPDRSKNFAPVVELLPDLPLVIYDRRGYGKSLDALPPATDFADHAQDLIAILGGRRAVVVAQSVGCNVAMAAAAKAPSLFAALGMWEPPTAWCDWWPVPDLRESVCSLVAATDTELLAEVFNRNILGDRRWESLSVRTKDMLRREGAAFHADMASELTALFDFADITCPVIIGAGTATGSGHLEGARRLARILNAEVFEVENADHFAPLTSPASWAELVRKAVALAGTDPSAHSTVLTT